MCAGIARERGVAVALVRAAFVAVALLGGIGAFVYVACWLIMPRDGEEPGDPGSPWLVRLAQAFGAAFALVILAAAAALATLFGFGWVVVGLAAGALAAVLLLWPRLGPLWALLPVAALTLPAVAVAASGLRLNGSTGNRLVAPLMLSAAGDPTFRAGLGTMLVDLRSTELPTSGVVRMRVDGGLRRTIVALPAGRCVYVRLDYDVRPLLANLAAQFTSKQPYSQVDVFGQLTGMRSGSVQQPPVATASSGGPGLLPGPVLRIDFTSAGGSFYVRDYPNSIDPAIQPDWPGYPVHPESRPDLRGVKKRQARLELRAWRARHAVEVRSMREVNALIGGPCLVPERHR